MARGDRIPKEPRISSRFVERMETSLLSQKPQLVEPFPVPFFFAWD